MHYVLDIETAEIGRAEERHENKSQEYEDKSYQAMREALRTGLSSARPNRVPAHLKLYAALAGLLGFRLNDEEAVLVLSIS